MMFEEIYSLNILDLLDNYLSACVMTPMADPALYPPYYSRQESRRTVKASLFKDMHTAAEGQVGTLYGTDQSNLSMYIHM